MSLSHEAYFVDPAMTVEQAAREANKRHCWLKLRWTDADGLRVVAVPRETTGEIYDTKRPIPGDS